MKQISVNDRQDLPIFTGETSYQLVRLPAWSVNRTKRLIRTPKMYWSDTGLALHLAGAPEPGGAHLENLVLADLLAWRDSTVTDRPGLLAAPWWMGI